MRKVKVKRYVAGQAPDFAADSDVGVGRPRPQATRQMKSEIKRDG
jgi:hypothetical protein